MQQLGCESHSVTCVSCYVHVYGNKVIIIIISSSSVAASLSFQYWDRQCNCWFFVISTKFNGLICNMEYVM